MKLSTILRGEEKGLLILRGGIALNIVTLITLVFYITNVLFIRIVAKNMEPEVKHGSIWTQLSWAAVFTLAILFVMVQLTLDIDMLIFRYRAEDSEEVRLKRVTNWMKISTYFLSFYALCFTSSLLVETSKKNNSTTTTTTTSLNPIVIFVLGFGGLVLRFLLLVVGHRYMSWLWERRDLDLPTYQDAS